MTKQNKNAIEKTKKMNNMDHKKKLGMDSAAQKGEQ